MRSRSGLYSSMRPWWLVVVAGSLGLPACDVGGHAATSHGGTGGGGGSPGAGGAAANSANSASSGSGNSSASSGSSSGGGGGGPMAPNGYYVMGNTIYDTNHQAHLFHGVARPSLEWNPVGE